VAKAKTTARRSFAPSFIGRERWCVPEALLETLKIENDLYDEFRRNAVVRSDEKTSEEDWDWDSYFLMQHHNGPTRLLDWSDGALMALHFALRNKADDAHDARVTCSKPTGLMNNSGNSPTSKCSSRNGNPS